ncbi:hypothetical protein HNY73_000031 [Argiope bruennichi]|uniref:Uncharacterized protein n=1 Tax=Argiope bruennichi TaxID=94029 RepID=A0A8T0G0Q8_ARGBR|nr:hypothetical protein HNY73_000031 [Argiope bruennichi]
MFQIILICFLPSRKSDIFDRLKDSQRNELGQGIIYKYHRIRGFADSFRYVVVAKVDAAVTEITKMSSRVEQVENSVQDMRESTTAAILEIEESKERQMLLTVPRALRASPPFLQPLLGRRSRLPILMERTPRTCTRRNSTWLWRQTDGAMSRKHIILRHLFSEKQPMSC